MIWFSRHSKQINGNGGGVYLPRCGGCLIAQDSAPDVAISEHETGQDSGVPEDSAMADSSPVNNASSNPVRIPRFSRISFPSDDEEDEIVGLQQENARLRANRDMADYKYATIVEFSGHQYRVISILSTHFAHLNSSQDKREKREISGKTNEVLNRAEDIIIKLNDIIPGIDKLVADQGNGQKLIDWINGDDHIYVP